MSLQQIADTEILLDLRGVTKAYRLEKKEFIAIKDIDLQIKPGEFVCLLGPSGCGKSTLLRIIAGLNRATSGIVAYHGKPLEGVNPYTTIVFQTFALYPWLSVQQNVEIALKARGVAPGERAEKSLKLIDTVGLDGFESAYPRELSGGMRQKVGFARAMAVEPELLCLDEPFSALDVLSAESLRGELMELWLKKKIPTKAILMVTHNIEEAVFMADRIVIMAKDPGRILTEIHVTLHHPRQRKDVGFQGLVDKVYAAVAGQLRTKGEALGSWPGEGTMRPLPHAQLSAVAGLVEKLVAEGGRVDLYRMGGELVLELDDLLPIVEAGDMLGFVTVSEGDLQLTALGRAYADATILARKAIIAGRVLRLPIIAWIYETLQRDDNGHVARDYFKDKLEADFGDRAEQQLDIAIQWGRFAELFSYDDDSEELYLETQDRLATGKNLALTELYEAWPVLSPGERVEGFRLLDHERAEDFFLQLSGKDKIELILGLKPADRKFWMRLLPADAVVEAVAHAPENERETLLALLDDKTRREAKGLMLYDEERNQGAVQQHYARLRPEMSVDEAISFLRRDARERSQSVYYAYVIDSEERLLGVVFFRDLLMTSGDSMIRDIMRTDVITAKEDVDGQELKNLFDRYNLQMIPMVDSERRIKGVVTRQDVAAGDREKQISSTTRST